MEMKTGVTFGKDITLESLKKDGYGAVFMGTGLHVSRGLSVPGEDLEGVLKGVDFLREVSLGNPAKVSKKTVVIGGGNVAIDVALSAVRAGGEDVTLVCLEQRQEMPAWDYEIAEALEEGVKIVNGWGPLEFVADGEKVSALETQEMHGGLRRGRPVQSPIRRDANHHLEGDTIIVAIGQAADLSFAQGQNIDVTPRGGLCRRPGHPGNPDPRRLRRRRCFLRPAFGGGSGGKRQGSGRKHPPLSAGHGPQRGREKDWSYVKVEPENEPKWARTPMRNLPLEGRQGAFSEIALGYNEEEAKAEAARCLKCGVCSECYQCVDACLAGAVDHR